MKWIIRLLGLVLVMAAIVLGALFFLPGDRIAKIAADQISAMTGRQVTMAGETRLSFYPVLGISTGKVAVANAGWSEAGPMISADSFKVGVDPSVLWGGDIRITGLEAVNPTILLERAADGRVNWELGVEGVAPSGKAAEPGKPAQSRTLALTLDRALITGATLRYIDHGTGQQNTLANSDLDLRWPAYQGEATFDAVLRPTGQDVKISGALGTVAKFIEGGISEMQATLTAPGGSLSFDGRGATLPQLAGAFNADLKDTAKFLGAVGISGVDIPKGLGRAITAKGDLTITDDMRITLRDGSLKLDHNSLNIAADVNLAGARPKVNAQLRAGALDLSALASGNSTGAGGSGGSGGGATTTGTAVSTGWSKDRIDASALGLLDGKIALVASALDFGTFNFGKTRILTTIHKSRAVFDLSELNGYGGLVSGEFVVNNRSGLSVGGDMNAKGINMKTLLTDAAGIGRFSTSGAASLKFLGVGASVDAIMKSLKGSASVRTGKGHISGFDLDKLMRSGNGTGGTTVFDRMSASFIISGGQMQNNDLTMSMPLAKATGAGRIGLGNQDIDYTFTPTILTGKKDRGLAIPVRIHGPWSNPRFTPDLEKAIDLNLKEEKKKLEKKARKEVNKRLEKELGVKTEEGQSVEDAVRKKLEKDAAKEIFKLFD
ncbi:AsmA family protein [uncultured Roseovarius sp.]|uniref:AsmA family protein n=1 Tax=uncultured Roseovarius sp. TaxID=293344 RepID=UPI00260694A9|nr:AsmA family protein [uncultured Roseovarius sp.]